MQTETALVSFRKQERAVKSKNKTVCWYRKIQVQTGRKAFPQISKWAMYLSA